MYKTDQKKWENFSRNVQLKNIAAEIARATQSALYKKEDSDWFKGAYERAISMIDASLSDVKWQDKNFLYELRDAIASLYVGETDPSLSRFLCSQTMKEAENMS